MIIKQSSRDRSQGALGAIVGFTLCVLIFLEETTAQIQWKKDEKAIHVPKPTARYEDDNAVNVDELKLMFSPDKTNPSGEPNPKLQIPVCRQPLEAAELALRTKQWYIEREPDWKRATWSLSQFSNPTKQHGKNLQMETRLGELSVNRYKSGVANGPRTDGCLVSIKSSIHYQIPSSAQQELAEELLIKLEVNDPSLQKLYGTFKTGRDIYQVLEYINGKSLKQYLETEKITPATAYNFIYQLASAVQRLWERGVIVSDLHSDKVVIDNRLTKKKMKGGDQQTVEVLKLLDAGRCHRVFKADPAETVRKMHHEYPNINRVLLDISQALLKQGHYIPGHRIHVLRHEIGRHLTFKDLLENEHVKENRPSWTADKLDPGCHMKLKDASGNQLLTLDTDGFLKGIINSGNEKGVSGKPDMQEIKFSGTTEQPQGKQEETEATGNKDATTQQSNGEPKPTTESTKPPSGNLFRLRANAADNVLRRNLADNQFPRLLRDWRRGYW